MKRIVFAGFTITILLALLLACAPAATPAAPAAPPKPAEGPVKGGVLRITVFGEPPNYDCYSATTALIQTHVAMAFNSLLRTDPMKTEVSVDTMIPDLAEKYELTPDKKTYTFYLRKGVKWHDGKPFTAKDVVYSLNKFRDPKKSAFAAGVGAIDKVEQVDDYTVKVYLKQPDFDFLLFILPPFFSVQAEHLKDVNPKSTDFLVGTGPFKFKQRVAGKLCSFVKNPDYFVPGLPYLDGVDIYYLAFPAMTDAFIGGELDVNGNLRSFFDTDIALLKRVQTLAPEAKYILQSSGTVRGIFFSFARKGPWLDPNVRKAMAMVLDYRDVVIAMAGGLELNYVVSPGVVPFNIPGAYTKDEVAKAMGTAGSLDSRIVAAQKLMKDAGYADGFDVECVLRQEAFRTNAALYCADIWKKHLKINMKTTVLDTAMFTDVRAKGEFDLTVDSLSVQTDATATEYLNKFITGEVVNFGKWSDPKYDDIYQQFAKEQDSAKRKELARKAQAMLYEALPFIPCTESTNGVAWRPDLMTGWPAKEGIIVQPTYTTMNSIDRIWLKGTDNAKRWIKK